MKRLEELEKEVSDAVSLLQSTFRANRTDSEYSKNDTGSPLYRDPQSVDYPRDPEQCKQEAVRQESSAPISSRT